MLHELVNDDFELEIVSLQHGQQYTPRYLGITPSHSVPALEVGTQDGQSMVMIESGAMITLLADVFLDKGLSPPANVFSHERADYLQIIHYCGAAIDMMLWQIRIHEHILPDGERDDRTIRRYRKKFIDEAEPELKRRLDSGGFACGGRFSAADCMIGYAVYWAQAYGLCTESIFEDYIARLCRRLSFQKAFADAHQLQWRVPCDNPAVELFTG